ncbi:hypothetical protein CFP56_038048 [Quercus suber]|uniref:Uncharacterized protein n=1 Tax=Quercus suber TaxID=58331 RepID=A0AAW0LMN5_QUESU
MPMYQLLLSMSLDLAVSRHFYPMFKQPDAAIFLQQSSLRRIQTKSNSNQVKPIINPPSSRGLVFAPTTLAFLANCIGPIVTILCDSGIRHLDMFYNAKYLS